MMRRLRVLLGAACLAGLASPAVASSARVFALGGDGAYLEDAVGARVWYGSLVDHGGWVALESGVFDQHGGYGRDPGGWRAAGPAAGAQVPLGRHESAVTCALWWDARAAQGGVGELGNDQLGSAWQLMFGRDFGPLAASLSVRHGAADEVLTTVADSLRHRATRDDFGLGVRWEASERVYVDVSGELVRLGDKTTVGSEPEVDRSTVRSYGFRARGFVALGSGAVVVPVAELRREDRAWDALGAADDRQARMWRLGAGLTWLPDPDHLLLAAVDWRSSRRRDLGTPGPATGFDRRVVALRLACEARIHALLTLRVASGFELVHLETVDPVATTDDHLVPLSAGLALHVGPCDLELALANQPPLGADGGREPWRSQDDSTWMTAGLSFWY